MNFSRLFLSIFLIGSSLQAAPPVPYTGKVAIDGVNFQGSASFAFEISDAQGTVHWRNGATPNDTISVSVANGRYVVQLGGQGMNPLPPELFLAHDELYLKVRFDPGDGQGLRHLGPDQRITATPYALAADLARLAQGVPPASITREMLADSVLADLNASITLNRLSPEVLAALGVLPSISTQPFALYDGATNTARFEVSGRGHALSYQWLKDGQPINGATAPVLHIADADTTDTADYSVRITNSLGETTSQVVSLQDAIGAPGHPLAEANATAVPRAGLVLWMDALDLNADGHADNVLLGDRISSWTDKITDKNATQAEWGNQPVKTANGVSFDGSNDFLKITDLNATAQHIFVVAKRRPKSGWIHLLSGNDNNYLAWYGSSEIRTDTHRFFTRGAGGSARVSAGPNSLTDNVTFVATLTVGADGSDNGVFLDLFLGSASSGYHHLDGEIHEVLFYDRILQDAERDAVEQYLAQKWGVTLYQDPPAEPENGLVAYYKFEPVSGSNWTNQVWDYSGNDRHLTMENFDDDPWDEGVVGDSLAFDGLNDRASSPDGVFNFNLKTVAFWAKPDVAVDGREDPNYVFKLENVGSGDYGFAFNHALQGGSGHWIIVQDQRTVETNANFNQTFQGWFHVAMVATQTDGESSYDFYANGNKLDTISTDPKTGFLKSVYDLRLGYYDYSYFKGRLDEFRIYDRILAPAEIDALFNSYQNPIVRTDGEHNATVGTSFSLSLAADNAPTTYLAEGLPAGLSLNVVTGQISGTLSQPGYHRVFVKAMNEHGTGSDVIAIVARPATDPQGWPVDVPDGSGIPQNGMVLWLDANDVDADGVLDSGTDHLKLANWADKAGKDHNATQATAFRQPAIRADQLPERPGLNLLRFDGNQSLAFPTLSNGRTFFWVINRGAGNGNSSFLALNGTNAWGSGNTRPFYFAADYISNGLHHRNGESINFSQAAWSFLTDLQVMTLRTTDFQPADLIGKRGNAENYFTGNIGEIIAYDRALSTSEIETVEQYLGSKWGIAIGDQIGVDLTTGLQVHLPFDAPDGNQTADISGNNRPATLVGFESNQTTWIAGKIGNAIQFDGTNDWGSIPYSLDANFTIALWLKSTDARGGYPHEWNRHNILLTGPNDTYGMFLSYGKFSFWLNSNSENNANNKTRLSSASAINTGSWVHLALSREAGVGNSGSYRTYINGSKDSGPFSKGVKCNTGALLYFGKAISSAVNYLNGALDDLRIYDRVLSDAEVKALHDLGQ